jgi:uncharacterized membrane protein
MTASTIDGLAVAGAVGAPADRRKRIEAIDLVRGAIMILMALDHARFFVTDVPFPPEDMARTWPALFFTRWVTHFCAPLFFLLAGMSAYLSDRHADPADARRHLIARGALLIVLELTIVGFGWNFTPGYSFAGVLWDLGWSMIALAVLRQIPARWLAAFSLAVIAGHDLLNGVKAESFGALEPLWRLLHAPGTTSYFGREWLVLWVFVPWFAVMSLGYACGSVWTLAPSRRQPVLAVAGIVALALFALLRITNGYGNPAGAAGSRLPFRVHDDPLMTVVSLLNVSKYPGSLQFMLMTLGGGCVALALADRVRERRRGGTISNIVATFGRVPMFYYVSHLYVIHLLALALAFGTQQSWQWLGWRGANSPPAGYGHGLVVVYATWGLSVLLLWFPSRWMDTLKRARRTAWLRYV